MQAVQKRLGLVLVSFALAAGTGCPDDEPAAPPPEETPVAALEAPPAPTLPPPLQNPPADPVAALSALLPGGRGHCVQVRSVPTRLEADQVAAEVRLEHGFEVALLEKDLGERGVWWRICVGDEPTRAAAEAKGREWTRKGGALRKFMAKVAPGQARFQVLERQGQPARAPTEAQASALLRGRPDERRPPHMASRAEGGFFAAVTLPAGEGGSSDVLVVDGEGQPQALGGELPEGCEACRAALEGGRPARRLLAVGDVGAWPGDELLIEETGTAETAVLSVFGEGQAGLVRRAAFLLGTQSESLRVLGAARALDADGEPGDELALVRLELPIVGDRLCALRERVELIDLRRSPPRRLDEDYASLMGVAEQSGGAGPAKRLIGAIDELGDADAASRVCAAYLSKGKDPGVASLCIARVSELLRRGQPVAAVNAAGLLSAASEPLRAPVAGPFYRAAAALDQDPALKVGSGDCESAPLVEGVAGKRLEHLVELARLRLQERVELRGLADEVFVTGARDFGPSAPVGKLTARWLERVKERLPARHAALEARLGAALAPPEPAPPAKGAPGPGEGGYIHIEVHDEPEEDEASP